jgi:opacity protein-like surface antigen
MSNSLRLLSLAAVLTIAAAGAAHAQTVIVRGAVPGETIEVVVTGGTTSTGQVGADGTATVAATLPAGDTGRPEMDARLTIDVCGTTRRVHILERAQLPPAVPDGCTRSEIGGVYWVRQRSIIVINVAGAIPDVLLRQGSYNPNAPVKRTVPTGLVAFGGGGLAKLSNATAIACGNVADCGDDGYVGAYNLGATLWVTRWLGVEGSYLRPSRTVAEGTASTYTFTSAFDADIVNAVVKLGIPLGPVRLFGQGGGTYHDGTNTMTQTMGGETQVVETRTDGWSYTYGGGLEAWINDRFALYAEAGQTKVKGQERLVGVIELDDTLTHYLFGVRFRIF